MFVKFFCSKLLGGGIESMAITEAFGGEMSFLVVLNVITSLKYYLELFQFHLTEFRTGKTQLSHTLCGEWDTFLTCLAWLIWHGSPQNPIRICLYSTFKSNSVLLLQWLRSCQERTATQEGKSSSLTQRTLCILSMLAPYVKFWIWFLQDICQIFNKGYFCSNVFIVSWHPWLTHAFSSRPDRLRDIADRFNVDHDAVLDNVLYARAYTSMNSYMRTRKIKTRDQDTLLQWSSDLLIL